VIFLTVGMQLPFDRLVSAVDRWAERSGRGDEVFAQIGPDGAPPIHVNFARKMTGAEFRDRLDACSLMVAHAGIGTITQALERGVPVCVMPRRASLGEHRNDHQVATCAELGRRYPMHVAETDDQLFAVLDATPREPAPRRASLLKPPESRQRLVAFIRDFCQGRDA